jgi:hypothetical protein
MKYAVAIVLLAACGSVSNEQVDAPAADSKAIDTPADSTLRRCDPTKPFAAPVRLAELSSTSNDLWPSLSPDELTVYFHSDRSGTGSVGIDDVYVATRASLSAPFGMPGVVANVNNVEYDQCPSITGDGRYLYVDRMSSSTGWDIWVAQRASTNVDFSAPTRVDSLNAQGTVLDSNQYILPDNSAIYFISTRTGNEEIHRAARNVGGTFEAPTTPFNLAGSSEVSVVVTPDELTMYFSSNATPTLGGQDIWMSKRTTIADGWGTPTHLVELSTDQGDSVSSISADGCNLYLSHYVDAGTAQEIFWARKPM